MLVDVVANLTYNYRDDWLSKVHTGVPNVETSSVCILHCQMCFRSKIYEPKGSDSKNEFVESLRETDVLSLENFENFHPAALHYQKSFYPHSRNSSLWS